MRKIVRFLILDFERRCKDLPQRNEHAEDLFEGNRDLLDCVFQQARIE